MDHWRSRVCQALVLDLRDSATGTPEDVDSAATCSSTREPSLTFRAKADPPELRRRPRASKSKLPLVPSHQPRDRGAAEVAAAAFWRTSAREVVGERTYGAAAIRKRRHMEDGSAVILSVAKYYSPTATRFRIQP